VLRSDELDGYFMKNNETIIKVENLTKVFKLPHERYSTMKQHFVNIFKPKAIEKLKALDNVSFEIKKGEFFGIIGPNGSGKSTLLKILAEIYQPTAGKIEINGSLSPFIELGVGFNPELTARENVFLNAAILGLSKTSPPECRCASLFPSPFKPKPIYYWLTKFWL
jgi:ABC-type polysaccharide/polyol phosphate transport system ATPase subunit